MKPARTLVLCGPLSDPCDKRALDNAAFALRALGFSVESPAEVEKPACGSWMGWMRAFLDQVTRADVVVTLQGWTRSREAKIVERLAVDLGLRVWPLHLALRQQPEGVDA